MKSLISLLANERQASDDGIVNNGEPTDVKTSQIHPEERSWKEDTSNKLPAIGKVHSNPLQLSVTNGA